MSISSRSLHFALQQSLLLFLCSSHTLAQEIQEEPEDKRVCSGEITCEYGFGGSQSKKCAVNSLDGDKCEAWCAPNMNVLGGTYELTGRTGTCTWVKLSDAIPALLPEIDEILDSIE